MSPRCSAGGYRRWSALLHPEEEGEGIKPRASKAPHSSPTRPAPSCRKGPPRISRGSGCCSHGGGSRDRLLLVWLLAGAHRRAPRETLDPAGKSLQGCSAALCLCLWPPRSPWMMAGFSFVPLCSSRTSSGHMCGASSMPGTWLRGAHQLSRPGCGQERSHSELQLWEGCPDRCFSLLSPLCRHFALDACCVQAGLCQERSRTPILVQEASSSRTSLRAISAASEKEQRLPQ